MLQKQKKTPLIPLSKEMWMALHDTTNFDTITYRYLCRALLMRKIPLTCFFLFLFLFFLHSEISLKVKFNSIS